MYTYVNTESKDLLFAFVFIVMQIGIEWVREIEREWEREK